MDIELAGTFLIAGIFIISLLTLDGQIMESNTVNSLNVIAQKNAANIATILLTDIRKIGQGLETATESVQSISDSSISFISDIDKDGDVDTVSYRLGSTEDVTRTENTNDRYLYRSVNGTEFDVALGITRLELTYFNSGGNPTIVSSEIRTIGISLTVETPFYYQERLGTAEWQGQVTPNNLKAI
ncbi:MAG: hypothetical protein PHW79_05320 [Candidatus Marinimicrobia bacterium]|nr:hypothetical protein [Candidatus Neomarinimicrobiota bacterium]